MRKKFLEAIEKYSLLDGVDSVTVALSGGADSMALLYLFCELKEQLNIKVYAAHFNHKIRGAEADRDEIFVKEQCEKMGVTIFTDSADVPRFAQENKLSVELAARNLRYEFLNTVAKGVIATAHTASDNLETMLLNLTRGTAAKGLSGIPVKRDNIIRPIILCTREDVEHYCKQNQISFITDSSNLSDEYSRNKIRLRTIPVLKELNGSVEKNALRAAQSVFEDNDFIDGAATTEFNQRFKCGKLSVSGFDKLHPALQKRVIKLFLVNLGVENLDNFHLLSVLNIAFGGGKTQISGDISLVSRRGVLELEQNDVPIFDVKIIKEKFNFPENTQKIHNLLLKNAIDCDKIVGELDLRTRLSGDSIRLFGRNCTKTLKKLFTEKQVPLNERDYIPVIADSKGVVWVYGLGVSERCAVDKKTSSIFKIEVSKK